MGRCRLQLSTTVKIRNGRRSAKMACTKSMLQRSEDRSGSGRATDATQYVSASNSHPELQPTRRQQAAEALAITDQPSCNNTQIRRYPNRGRASGFFRKASDSRCLCSKRSSPAASISCSLLPVAATAASSLTPDARTSSSRRKAYSAMPNCRQRSLSGGDVMFVP